jgi:hypothetical protein
MIDSRKVLYSKGKNDECYTPRYGVEPIFKYALYWVWSQQVYTPPTIWMPFDTEDSEFVKVFKERPDLYTIVHSHISEGKDFYEYEPEQWDVMISNPPFTRKRQIFERALSFNKPFALLAPLTWLNDAAPKQLFKEKELQLLMFDKRIKFGQGDKITFSSAYYCWNFLPKQIIMEELKV